MSMVSYSDPVGVVSTAVELNDRDDLHPASEISCALGDNGISLAQASLKS